MPETVSSTKDSATSSSVGNSRCGNTPAQATISQIVPTTTNGKILRATTRQRSSPLAERPGAPITVMVVTASCIAAGAPPLLLACGLGPLGVGLVADFGRRIVPFERRPQACAAPGS